MTPELIDLYRGVQKYRGEWQPFDPVLYKGQPGTITDKSEGQVEIFTPESKGGYYQWVMANDPDLLWVPPVWSDDGRCLYDMIERDFSVTRIWYDSDDQTTDDGWIYGVDFIDGEFIGYYNSLPEALLRAIKEQEGSNADG